MRDTRVRGAQTRTLLVRNVHGVRVPNVGPYPAELFGKLDGAAAEALQTKAFFVQRLGQVRVQVDAARLAPARRFRA